MAPDKHVLLVCEDKRSAKVVKTLFERVLDARGSNELPIAETRNPAANPADSPSWITPRHAVEQVKRAGLPLFGKMRSDRGLDPQVAAASILARHLGSAFAIFTVDADRHPDREPTILAAAAQLTGTPVCAGVATPEIESWLLVVAPDSVRTRLRQDIQFDPIKDPHRLSSTAGGKRDAKTVFARAFDDEEAAMDMLSRADVEALRRDGVPSGLAPFIDALDTRGVEAWSATD